ncbi:SMP-30/gluconolactonase/LRE family protein [Nocardia mexicana]|nr:SMP-30/gluconolactonase/LRE family protein [Nocardia mexicana]
MLAPTAVAATAHATPAAAEQCGGWSATQIASGYGMLESLEFDGRGGLLLSEQAATGSGGGIRRLDANGGRTTMAGDVDGPGMITVSGDTAYFTTGLSLQSKLTGRKGGIRSMDLRDGRLATVAEGLDMPNGIAALPNGDFVVSSDMGADTRLTRVAGATIGPFGPPVTSTNGLAYDKSHNRLYVSSTFNPTTTLTVVDLDHPSQPSTIELPGFGPLNGADGVTIGPDGNLYIAYSTGGKVIRVDPTTHHWCTIAENLPLTTEVKFGTGPGWAPNSLYATSYLGTVTRLTPADLQKFRCSAMCYTKLH